MSFEICADLKNLSEAVDKVSAFIRDMKVDSVVPPGMIDNLSDSSYKVIDHLRELKADDDVRNYLNKHGSKNFISQKFVASMLDGSPAEIDPMTEYAEDMGAPAYQQNFTMNFVTPDYTPTGQRFRHDSERVKISADCDDKPGHECQCRKDPGGWLEAAELVKQVVLGDSNQMFELLPPNVPSMRWFVRREGESTTNVLQYAYVKKVGGAKGEIYWSDVPIVDFKN